MRKPVASSIRDRTMKALEKRGLPFSKKAYRAVKRAYSLVPRNKKNEFNVV